MNDTFVSTSAYNDTSLGLLELIWVGVLVLAFLAPGLLYLVRQCQRIRRSRDTASSSSSSRLSSTGPDGTDMRSVILQSLIVNQHVKTRRQYLKEHLVTHKVVATPPGLEQGDTPDDHDGGPEESKRSIPFGCQVACKGDVVLSSSSSTTTTSSVSLSSSVPITLSDMDEHPDNDTPICAICVSPYQVGEEICWSTNTKCQHYFHKACIHEWLIRHVDCPCCRLLFLVPCGSDLKKHQLYHHHQQNDPLVEATSINSGTNNSGSSSSSSSSNGENSEMEEGQEGWQSDVQRRTQDTAQNNEASNTVDNHHDGGVLATLSGASTTAVVVEETVPNPHYPVQRLRRGLMRLSNSLSSSSEGIQRQQQQGRGGRHSTTLRFSTEDEDIFQTMISHLRRLQSTPFRLQSPANPLSTTEETTAPDDSELGTLDSEQGHVVDLSCAVDNRNVVAVPPERPNEVINNSSHEGEKQQVDHVLNHMDGSDCTDDYISDKDGGRSNVSMVDVELGTSVLSEPHNKNGNGDKEEAVDENLHHC